MLLQRLYFLILFPNQSAPPPHFKIRGQNFIFSYFPFPRLLITYDTVPSLHRLFALNIPSILLSPKMKTCPFLKTISPIAPPSIQTCPPLVATAISSQVFPIIRNLLTNTASHSSSTNEIQTLSASKTCQTSQICGASFIPVRDRAERAHLTHVNVERSHRKFPDTAPCHANIQ